MWVHLTNQPVGARECKQADSPGQANPQKYTEENMKNEKREPTQKELDDAMASFRFWLAYIKLRTLKDIERGVEDV